MASSSTYQMPIEVLMNIGIRVVAGIQLDNLTSHALINPEVTVCGGRIHIPPGLVLPDKQGQMIQKVDIFNQNDLAPHMKGSDAVMSCLGSTAMFTRSTIYTASIKVISSAMREAGVTRFIAISSWGTKYDPGLPWVVKWLLRPIFLRQILPDMGSMEDYLSESCQDLDFTVVRPAQLTHDKSSGQEVIAVEGQCVPDVAMKIARSDLARFMLKCAVSGEWKKKHVAVGVK